MDQSFSVTIITKAKVISFSFCLLSIIMLVYICIQIWIYDKENHVNFNQYIYLLAAFLSILSNLLLYQGILEKSLGFTYWPNSNCCLLSWILVHIIVIGILFLNTISCFYSLSNKTNSASSTSSGRKNEDETSQKSLILLSVLLILGQLLILLGIKVVLQFYGASNKDDSDEE